MGRIILVFPSLCIAAREERVAQRGGQTMVAGRFVPRWDRTRRVSTFLFAVLHDVLTRHRCGGVRRAVQETFQSGNDYLRRQERKSREDVEVQGQRRES